MPSACHRPAPCLAPFHNPHTSADQRAAGASPRPARARPPRVPCAPLPLPPPPFRPATSREAVCRLPCPFSLRSPPSAPPPLLPSGGWQPPASPAPAARRRAHGDDGRGRCLAAGLSGPLPGPLLATPAPLCPSPSVLHVLPPPAARSTFHTKPPGAPLGTRGRWQFLAVTRGARCPAPFTFSARAARAAGAHVGRASGAPTPGPTGAAHPRPRHYR